MRGTLVIVALCVAVATADDCAPRDFGHGSVVCVCNASYCDTTPDANLASDDSVNWYASTKAGLRMSLSQPSIGQQHGNGDEIRVDRKRTFQKIIGFGGAFTDSAAINIKSLSEQTQEVLMQQYFGPEGSRYSVGRLPVAGTDFSSRGYTYDDHPSDVNLTKFSLQPEDTDYKIPLIHAAKRMSPDLIFFASCWTAPAWMKTSNSLVGIGVLKEEYYQTYTDYLLKFLQAYVDNNITIWAITTGNEPADGVVPGFSINAMGWVPKTMGKWVSQNIGPSIVNSKFNYTYLMILDDQRIELPWYVDDVFKYWPDAKNYIDGIAVHWYWDDLSSPDILDVTHDKYPYMFMLMTEACTGVGPFVKYKVSLGNWDRAEEYIVDIIENINHWMAGWIDWNLALDMVGGPNWVHNNVDAAIIVGNGTDEFYKQPMYYAIKHVSRFVPRGSTRISVSEPDAETLKSLALLTPDNEVVVVLCNLADDVHDVSIKDGEGRFINLQLPERSINTVIYK